MKYVITNINGTTNVITVQFLRNNGTQIGVDQKMGDAPLDSLASLDAYLKDYGKAYRNGINNAVKPAIPAEITAAVGVQSVDDGT